VRVRGLHRRTPVILLSGQVLTAFVAFVMNILSSNVLAPAERGTLAFFLQVSYIATTFSLLGVERPYIAARPFTAFPTAIRELGDLTRTAWIGALVLTGAAAFLALTGSTTSAGMTVVAAIYMLANVFIRRLRVAYISSGTLRPFIVSTVSTQLVLLLAGTALFFSGSTSEIAWLFAYALSGVVAPAVTFVSIRRPDNPTGAHSSTSELRAIRREGLRLFPASFGNTALVRSDRLLLPFLSSPAELGRYVAVATVMEMGTWPVQQWVDSSLGKWRAQGDKLPMRRLVFYALSGALMVTLAVAVLTFAAITFLLPPEYEPALQLLPALALGTILYAATRIQQGLLIARGHSGSVSIAETVGMVASLALYVALIPSWGAMGAAVGSAIGYGVVLIVAVTLGRVKTRK
jgi:O-antigen/teichoic acid export membrane protein